VTFGEGSAPPGFSFNTYGPPGGKSSGAHDYSDAASIPAQKGSYPNGAMIFTWPMPGAPTDLFPQLFAAVLAY
jgi:hypothetical protein